MDSYYADSFAAQDAGLGLFLAIYGVVFLIAMALNIIVIIGQWKIFVKAGKPGWASIIPIYSTIVMLDIIKRPVWWIALLLLVPGASLVLGIMMAMDLAQCFGKSQGWGVGMLWLLSFIGYPMLGFGKDTYTAPARVA